VSDKHTSSNHARSDWQAARELAYSLVQLNKPELLSLDQCDKRVCAQKVTALTDLPFADSSSMDGWAVHGSGPWQVVEAEKLAVNQASVITTGATLPIGAEGIIRTENGVLEGEFLRSDTASADDIRRAGEECRTGQVLCSTGETLNPAMIGLLAATGYDEVKVFAQPRVQLIITGDELLTSGLPSRQYVRDSLGMQIPMWLQRIGAHLLPVVYVADRAEEISHAVSSSSADFVITTGGTAASAKDHFKTAIDHVNGEVLVNSVEVRPGHPMKLALMRNPSGKALPVVGLPGNPLAAIVALLTLAAPLVAKMLGQEMAALTPVQTSAVLKGAKSGTRLIPGSVSNGIFASAEFSGSAMLRGLSCSTGFAVVTTAVDAGDSVDFLALPL